MKKLFRFIATIFSGRKSKEQVLSVKQPEQEELDSLHKSNIRTIQQPPIPEKKKPRIILGIPLTNNQKMTAINLDTNFMPFGAMRSDSELKSFIFPSNCESHVKIYYNPPTFNISQLQKGVI